MNPLKAAWVAGATTFGVWGAIDSTFAAELLSSEGPDYFCCDQQHGVHDAKSLVAMFQAVQAGGTAPITRVPNHDPMLIGQALDAGALGVIIPMVRDAHDAAQLVKAFRYQPEGVRSYGPIRAGLVHAGMSPEALSDVACIPMIETASALEEVDAIAATPGVDALYVGPADLSLSLGLPLPVDAPEGRFRDALETIVAACERHGVTPGIHCLSGAAARLHQELGFRMITSVSDIGVMRAGVRAQLALARSA